VVICHQEYKADNAQQHRKTCQAVHDLHQHVVDVAQVCLHRLQQQRRLAEHSARARELHGAVHLAADARRPHLRDVRLRRHRHRQRLASQCGLINIDLRGAESVRLIVDGAVRRDGRAAGQLDLVARNDDARVDVLPATVAVHRCQRLQRLLQGRHRIAGLGRLVPSDGRVTELDGKQNRAVGPVLQRELDDDGDPQRDGHGTPQAFEEDDPSGRGLLRQLVAAKLLEAGGGFRGGQAVVVVGIWRLELVLTHGVYAVHKKSVRRASIKPFNAV
jgi:hypothetical protein